LKDITVNDVYSFLKSIAPEEMAAQTDNVGFLVGRGSCIVSNILISLDVTNDVISEALETGADLIIAHHPLFFSLSKVTDEDITGSKIIRMLSGGVSAICMHTNLDAARDGVNDTLAVAVGIADDNNYAQPLSYDVHTTSGETISFGRVGFLKKPCTMIEFLHSLKKVLNVNGLRYHDAGRDVFKIAIASGSGGSEWDNALKNGCDTFVTADIKYQIFLNAKEAGINIIDAGHFSTENVICKILFNKLRVEFPETKVSISTAHKQTVDFF